MLLCLFTRTYDDSNLSLKQFPKQDEQFVGKAKFLHTVAVT